MNEQWWLNQPGRENGPMLEQQFLTNQPLTFAELMALYAWSAAGWRTRHNSEVVQVRRHHDDRPKTPRVST